MAQKEILYLARGHLAVSERAPLFMDIRGATHWRSFNWRMFCIKAKLRDGRKLGKNLMFTLSRDGKIHIKDYINGWGVPHNQCNEKNDLNQFAKKWSQKLKDNCFIQTLRFIVWLWFPRNTNDQYSMENNWVHKMIIPKTTYYITSNGNLHYIRDNMEYHLQYDKKAD